MWTIKAYKYLALGLLAYVGQVGLQFHGNACLPQHLRGTLHTDYIRGLRWIPRSVTVFCNTDPPKQLLGCRKHYTPSPRTNLLGPQPIPPPGEFQLSFAPVGPLVPLPVPIFAMTTLENLHIRFGARWDNVDDYYTFSLTIKRLENNWEKALWYASCG